MKRMVIVLTLMILLASFAYAADENMFEPIIELIEDVFELIGGIFTIDAFGDPKKAFGIIVASFWLLLVTIINLALRVAFNGQHQRQMAVISVVIATMTVVLLNLEKSFFITILSQIGSIIIIIISMFTIAGPIVIAHSTIGQPTRPFHNYIYFIVYLLGMLMSLLVAKNLEQWLKTFKTMPGILYSVTALMYWRFRNGS